MTDCIIDQRKPSKDGYVRTIGNKYAHRIAWEKANGHIPTGMCVLHRCDVRNCVNPDHLFLGTKGDNNKDRSKKGRTSRHNSKLSIQQVREIRRSKRSQRYLAKKYAVSQRAILNVLKHRTYQDV